MLQNLQKLNFAKCQNFQLDNFVDFEKCCKMRIFLQTSVPIQPKTSNILPKFCRSAVVPIGRRAPAAPHSELLPGWNRAVPTSAARSAQRASPATRRVVANFWQNFDKMLLVFGCIGSDFCKKICVLQHFSKSTRFSS